MTAETKVCKICQTEKTVDNFRVMTSRGCKYVGGWCLSCEKEYKKRWADKNKDKIKERQKQYRIDNIEELREKKKIYREKNIEEIRIGGEKWRQENRDYLKDYNHSYRFGNKREKVLDCQRRHWELRKEEYNEYRRNDEEYKKRKRLMDKRYREKHYKEMMSNPHHRIRVRLSKRIREAVKEQSGRKCMKSAELLGCEMDFFIKYIESLFTNGMTWENYGQYGWHIDHIIPCASFDLTNPDQQKACFHYTNLQPLWWEDNIKKSDKIQVLTSEGVFSV